MRNRIALLVVSSLLAACGATGIQPDSFDVEILAAGAMSFEEREDGIGDRLTALKPGTTLPFIRGTDYGFVYRVSGEPADANIQLKLQMAITPASTKTGKRSLAKLYQPIYRQHAMGDVRTFYTSVGYFRQARRPFEVLLMVVDMNGNILARENFTVVDREELPEWSMADTPPLSDVMMNAVSDGLSLQNRVQ